MGILFLQPEMQQGESEIWRTRANHVQATRAVGGSLHLTNQRLLFEPHRFERMLKASPWSCDLTRVALVETRQRSMREALAGGLTKRLEVALLEGGSELFVVPSTEIAIDQLEKALPEKDR